MPTHFQGRTFPPGLGPSPRPVVPLPVRTHRTGFSHSPEALGVPPRTAPRLASVPRDPEDLPLSLSWAWALPSGARCSADGRSGGAPPGLRKGVLRFRGTQATLFNL